MPHDRKMQKAVLEELGWEPSIAAAHIGVTAKSGVVTLSGRVDDYSQKHAAEAAAGRVKGVRAVVEEIDVRLPVETVRSDEDIAETAVSRLAWNVLLPRHAVTVKVEKGWVTLNGELPWQYQKEAAEDDVRCLLGVVGVSNQLTVVAEIEASDVKGDIMLALHRSRFFDPDQITVTVEKGKIRLSGRVETSKDWRMASRIAWAAPGATNVENDIEIA